MLCTSALWVMSCLHIVARIIGLGDDAKKKKGVYSISDTTGACSADLTRRRIIKRTKAECDIYDSSVDHCVDKRLAMLRCFKSLPCTMPLLCKLAGGHRVAVHDVGGGRRSRADGQRRTTSSRYTISVWRSSFQRPPAG